MWPFLIVKRLVDYSLGVKLLDLAVDDSSGLAALRKNASQTLHRRFFPSTYLAPTKLMFCCNLLNRPVTTKCLSAILALTWSLNFRLTLIFVSLQKVRIHLGLWPILRDHFTECYQMLERFEPNCKDE